MSKISCRHMYHERKSCDLISLVVAAGHPLLAHTNGRYIINTRCLLVEYQKLCSNYVATSLYEENSQPMFIKTK